MEKWERWVCTICDFIYDPYIGDPDNGIEPGTPFMSLPKDWVCPDCGADTVQFEPAYSEELFS